MAVTINQTATEFVNQINNDVAAAAQSGGSSGGGGSVSTLSRTIKMKTQGGRLVNGSIVGESSIAGDNMTRDSFMRYCHTTLMLGIENCSITNVAKESGETLSISCFDANGDYIKSVADVSEIEPNACYVKFQVNKSSDYTSLRILEITVSGKPTFHKNKLPLMDYDHFLFETKMPNIKGGVDSTNAYTGGTSPSERFYDKGYVMLPPNYTMDGDPVPLVVCCHGTSGFQFSKVHSKKAYYYISRFLANNGYAICDCTGVTNKYSNVTESFGAPTYAASLANLVKFLTENLNVKDDGVYVMSKSAGGFMSHYLAVTQPFKVRAVGSFSPALSPIISLINHTRYYTQTANMEAAQIGISYTFNGDYGANDRNAVLNNITKWRQIDPFFLNTDLTDDEVKAIVYDAHNLTPSATTDGLVVKTNSSYNGTTVDLSQRCRRVTCPTKIWSGINDVNAPHDNVRLFVEMAQRGGSPCYLRAVPGGHNDVDWDENALTIQSYNTKYGGVVTNTREHLAGATGVVVAVAELVDWFNQW